MDGIRLIPLTVDQKRRLDSNGNRVWTEEETRIIHRNLALHDCLRTIFLRRCGVSDCRFIIGETKESFALPTFSDVCEICHTMFHALKNPRLRSTDYFVNLHDKWRREQNDPKRNDRLGL